METRKTRREQEREARRQLMLQAAREVFAERGFRKATLDEIAERSEFGKGTLYNYFPDGKDEMLFAILDDVYGEVYDLSLEAFAEDGGGSFSENLERYIEAFIEFFLRELDLFVIVMKEANRLAFGDDPSKAVYLRDQYERIKGVLEPHVERAIERGELKPYDATTVSHMILGNIHGYLRFHCMRCVGPTREEGAEVTSARDATRFISDVLLHGLTAEREPESANLIRESSGKLL